jgi:hypothetical protein
VYAHCEGGVAAAPRPSLLVQLVQEQALDVTLWLA